MKNIPLSQGLYVTVDNEEYDSLSIYQWQVMDRGGKTPYAVRTERHFLGKKTIYMHRQIMGFPKGSIDHINGNGLDCRKSNMRIASSQQNQANKGVQSNKKSSKFKGVYRHSERKSWSAKIGVDMKLIHIGNFQSEIEAAVAYDDAAVKYFGEFARLNFPERHPR